MVDVPLCIRFTLLNGTSLRHPVFSFLDNFDFMEGMQLHYRRPFLGRQRGLVFYFMRSWRISFRYNPRRRVLRKLNLERPRVQQYD